MAGAFMYCLYFVERSALDSNLPFLGRRIVLAAAINLALAVLALGLKMVNRSGAVCGFLLGVAVYLGWGYKSFLLMFAFFAIGSVATRMGYARKAARGMAEKRGGARSWREAVANSLAGAFFSLLVITTHHEGAFLMALDRGVCGSHGRHHFQRNRPVDFRPRLPDHDIQTCARGRRRRSLPGRHHGGRAGIRADSWRSLSPWACAAKAWPSLPLQPPWRGICWIASWAPRWSAAAWCTNGIVNFAGTSFAGALALAIALRIGY